MSRPIQYCIYLRLEMHGTDHGESRKKSNTCATKVASREGTRSGCVTTSAELLVVVVPWASKAGSQALAPFGHGSLHKFPTIVYDIV